MAPGQPSRAGGTRLKLMCRLGCLPTMIRVAREEKMPPEMGVCRMCGKVTEDVCHVLLACDAYAGQRARMVGGTDRGLELAGIAPLLEQEEVNQLDLLFGKTTGVMEAGDRISKCVAHFLKKAWRSRKPHRQARRRAGEERHRLGAQGAWGREGRLGVPAVRARGAPT